MKTLQYSEYTVHHIQIKENIWENRLMCFQSDYPRGYTVVFLCCRLTDEVRELFAGMGSSMVYSVKYRDNWVFAGAVGLNKKSPFEKVRISKEKMFEEFFRNSVMFCSNITLIM